MSHANFLYDPRPLQLNACRCRYKECLSYEVKENALHPSSVIWTQMMLPLSYLFSLVLATAAAVPYQQYILAPSSRTVRPVTVFRKRGPVTSDTVLLDGHRREGHHAILQLFNSSVTYDFGKNIAGLVNLHILSHRGSVGVTFSESSLWVSSAACDATADSGLDAPLVFNITTPGTYVAPKDKERGAFRYLTVVNLGKGELSIGDLSVHFTAMPHWKDNALRDYTGWFHSNDEKLNRSVLSYFGPDGPKLILDCSVWYAGAAEMLSVFLRSY